MALPLKRRLENILLVTGILVIGFAIAAVVFDILDKPAMYKLNSVLFLVALIGGLLWYYLTASGCTCFARTGGKKPPGQ